MEILHFGNPHSANVLMQPVGEHDISEIEAEVLKIKEFTDVEFQLAAVKVDSWNDDLSPWKAPAVFGKTDFGGNAENTLSAITKLCDDPEKRYYIGGYSLAGLFSIWAACQTNIFSGVAAASPSVWFPQFVTYIKKHSTKASAVYLSLGNKEEKTRNEIMAKAGECIRECKDILTEQNVDCVLEWNEGNHFKDTGIRTAKAFAWVLSQKPE